MPGTMREAFLLRKPPAVVIYLVLLFIIATFVPLALLAKARYSTSPKPRVHYIQDMDNQPRYNPQAPDDLFADGRAMRLPVPGTVIHGQADTDDHYYRGFVQIRDDKSGTWSIQYFKTIPPQIKVNELTMKHGQTLFATYCSPCHGLDGRGQGAVFIRAQAIKQTAFTPPADLTAQQIRDRPDGHIYNTIRNGIRHMPAYGSQIDTEDRWAIVAYVRALQRAQHANVDDVPADQRDQIR
jgi:mono/diheme cytochrome c family protein